MLSKRITDEELEIIFDDLLDIHGYDFSEYSRASIRRRIERIFAIDKTESFEAFRQRLRDDKDYLRRFIEEITVNVTEMFRDPAFFLLLRQQILPLLAAHPLIRIWHAGCSTGEEVYSMAILLKEANLLHKSLIYATDINPRVLEIAGQGIFPIQQMKQNSENYILSGGQTDFSSYYTANYTMAKFDATLRKKIVFASHNLVSGSTFNEFQLILCRNVMIYFNKELQDKALLLFDSSLEQGGYLALGAKETLRFSPIASSYRQVSKKERIWQKMT